jgi:hypothetical protein
MALVGVQKLAELLGVAKGTVSKRAAAGSIPVADRDQRGYPLFDVDQVRAAWSKNINPLMDRTKSVLRVSSSRSLFRVEFWKSYTRRDVGCLTLINCVWPLGAKSGLPAQMSASCRYRHCRSSMRIATSEPMARAMMPRSSTCKGPKPNKERAGGHVTEIARSAPVNR